MKKSFTIAAAVAIGVFLAAAPALADYVLILKNGRRITLQSYREDAGMIKFYGLGGEIGISKDQIQAIRKAGEQETAGPSVARPEPEVILQTKEPTAESEKVSPPPQAVKPTSPEESIEDQRAKEEKEYRQRVEKITGEIRGLRDRYAAETTGVVGPEPGFFTSQEAFRAHQADLLSRLRDAQNRAQGLETGSGAETPPLSLNAPPAYTEKQKKTQRSQKRDYSPRKRTAESYRRDAAERISNRRPFSGIGNGFRAAPPPLSGPTDSFAHQTP